MRHATFQRTRIAAAAAILGAMLAACGGQPTPPATQPTSAPAPTAAAGEPTAIPAPTSAPSEPTAAPGEPTAVPAPTEEPQGEFEPGSPIRTRDTQFGVVSHLYYTDRSRVLTLTNIAGFTWTRQQIQWKDIEGPNPGEYAWGELDNIVNDAAANNIKLLISIVKSPTFYNPTNGLPSDPTAMGNFVEALMLRYGDKIGAVEIWNEQNLAVENGGRVTVEDAGRYVEILVESYNRIKAISPNTIVLAGAPSSTNFEREDVALPDEKYYRAMYSYKDGLIKGHFDAQAVHPGGAANPPDTMFPDKPNTIANCPPELGSCWTDDPTHYFRHIENVRRFMVEEGVGDHQIWVTEFGWTIKNNTPGYEFGNFVSPEQQAQYIVDAMRQSRDTYRDEQGKPWVGVMFLWNMNFAVLWGGEGNPDHEQAAFGILNPDWSPRPSFLAIQSYLAEIKK
ncbi:MAG: cellulase family glycosylhydrolase [Roseiflexaceae bacterium]